jgi:hypothetical protein
MIAGMPWTAWLLLIAAVGTGLTVVLVHYCRGPRQPSGPHRDRPNEGR